MLIKVLFNKWFALYSVFLLAVGITSAFAQQNNAIKQALKRSLSPPLGLPRVPHPKDNPPSIEKIQLGEKLFFDTRLSRGNTVSCASCHDPKQAFTQNDRKTSAGFAGRSGRRNAPGLLNTAYYERYFQDGRETSLETHFIFPTTAANEMANPSVGFVIEKLKLLDEYSLLFENAFGRGPSVDTIGQALAAYQRTLISGNSRFDRWYYGKEQGALTATEIAGFQLFTGKAKCSSCHQIEENYALFTDQAFHDIGYGWQREQQRANANFRPLDLGRYEVTKDPFDKWRYRTPTLRNIELTAPYMHDGGLKTLQEVVQFYNGGGAPHKGQDHRIKKLALDNKQVESLVAFLKSLTGEDINFTAHN